MPITNTLTLSGTVGGAPMNGLNVPINSDGALQWAPVIPKAIEGTLSTRTSDTAGIITVQAGHGIVALDVISLFFADGRRYDAAVESVTATTITFGGVTPGSGDVLPAQDDPITLCKQVVISADFAGDDLIAIMCRLEAEKRAVVSFYTGSTNRKAIDLKSGNGYAWVWLAEDGGGAANPLAGFDIDGVQVAHESTSDQTFRMGINFDSTP